LLHCGFAAAGEFFTGYQCLANSGKPDFAPVTRRPESHGMNFHMARLSVAPFFVSGGEQWMILYG
jgi:hypothetical protein